MKAGWGIICVIKDIPNEIIVVSNTKTYPANQQCCIQTKM